METGMPVINGNGGIKRPHGDNPLFVKVRDKRHKSEETSTDMGEKKKHSRQLQVVMEEDDEAAFSDEEDESGQLPGKITQARSYQLETLKVALERNTIMYLETGCGKTLVAVLLMQEIGSQMSDFDNRIMIFLAPTVQLVEQQFNVIQINTHFKVLELHGAKGVDNWTNEQWIAALNTYQVFVMTPQVLLDALARAYVKLEFLRLLIFDECHHARGNHPYFRIMQEYYRNSPTKPKIFGMTASPLSKKIASSREDCEDQIAELEFVFDSKVYTLEDRSEIECYMPKAIHKTLYYNQPMFDYADVHEKLASLLEKYKIITETTFDTEVKFNDYEACIKCLKKQINCVYGNVKYCLENFGLYGAFQALQIYKDRRIKIDIIDSELNPQSVDIRNCFMEEASQIIVSGLPKGFKNINLERGANYGVKDGLLTHKVLLLFSCLLNYVNKKEICCIIFVERVISAPVISNLIKELDLFSYVRSDYLTGKGMQDNMTTKKKHQILDSFRSGQVDVLVTTNISEEGIDVQKCSCIVQFDFPQSLNSFTQSRGRLRRQDSHYIIFVERNNKKHVETLFNFIKNDKSMLDIVSNRGERISCPITWRKDANAYQVSQTGAVINDYSSVGFIYRYCSQLPGYSYYQPQPEFSYDIVEGEMYVCKLRLPHNAAFKDIVGPPSKKKYYARQFVCLEAAKQLHQLGVIDDNLHHLLSEYEDVEEIFKSGDKKIPITGTTKRKELHSTTQPTGFCGSWLYSTDYVTLHMYKLSFSGKNNKDLHANLALLVESELEDDVAKTEMDLYLTRGRVVKLQFISCGKLSLTPRQIKDAKTFQEVSFNGMFGRLIKREKAKGDIAIIRSIYENNQVENLWIKNNMYLLIPLEQGNVYDAQIDWKSIAECAKVATYFCQPAVQVESCLESTELLNLADSQVRPSDLIGKAIMTIHTGKIYSTVGLLNDKTAQSTFPSREKQAYTTYADYFQRKYGLKIKHLSQPLVQLKQSHRVHNVLQPFAHKTKGTEDADIDESNEVTLMEIPAELCLNLGVPNCIVRTLYLVPSIMYRITNLMLASQLRQEINKNLTFSIPSTLIMQAMTTMRCSEIFSSERLELLGDSVLKYAVSCYLFVKYSDKHEGQLTLYRSKAVCNATLHQLAIHKNLPGYIRDEPFDPLKWIAPGTYCTRVVECRCEEMEDKSIEDDEIIVKIGKACNKGHRWMTSKTISDGIEALIGAYMVGGGLDAAYHVMNWMGIQVMFKPSQLKPVDIHPNILKKVKITDLESQIGYVFQNKAVLVEAMTHASAQDIEGRICYQRLEFLGDAALDLLITKHLFFENKSLPPGHLTDLRAAAVNNQTFAFAAVKHGLQKHFRHSSGLLFTQITDFADYASKINQTEYCDAFGAQVEAPKVLGDILESIAGAILVDNGFNLEQVWNVMKPLLSPIVTCSSRYLHPIREVNEICDSNGFVSKWSKVLKGDRAAITRMEVTLKDCVIVGESTKVSVKNAKKEAASKILMQLDEKQIYHSYRHNVEEGHVFVSSKELDVMSDASDRPISPLEETEFPGQMKYANLKSEDTSNGNLSMKAISDESKIIPKDNVFNNEFIPLQLNKGGPRNTLYSLCKRRAWVMPRFEELVAENARRLSIRTNWFAFRVILQIPNKDQISVSGDQKLDKNSAKDSAALLLLVELEKRGICSLTKT
uniref:Dicer-like 3 n=1 Tax=Ephedra trifurca TaxID=39583 RepID=A0A0C4VYQ2_9SPER|nr:Dicer-like 3 [Ephedra trifurca]